VSAIAEDPNGQIVVSGRTYDLQFPLIEGAYQDTMYYGGTDPYAGYISKFTSDLYGLEFSTFFGNGEEGSEVAINSDGSIWWVGEGADSLFPLTANAFDTINSGYDIGVAKLSPDGSTLLFGSYLGGEEHFQWGIENFGDLAIDNRGNLYVTGSTQSASFPATSNALMPEYVSEMNGFLASISTDGELRYSTYFHGSSTDEICVLSNIFVVNTDLLWITGYTQTGNLPTTPNAFDIEFNPDSSENPFANFFALLDIAQNQIIYCSYLHTSVTHVPWGNTDTLILAGYTHNQPFSMPVGAYQHEIGSGNFTAYVLQLALPSTIVAGTFYGASYDNYLREVARSHDGTIVIAGLTNSFDLPLTPNAFDSVYCHEGEFNDGDGFVARFSADFSSLLYSSYIGGCQLDRIQSLITHGDTTYVVGKTESNVTFPTTSDAMYPTAHTSLQVGFVSKVATESVTPVESNPLYPSNFSLSAFPNPFNPTTKLSFSLPHLTNVMLKIHDILGREVERVQLGQMTAGQHEFKVNGEAWASGIYFASLETPTRSQATKLLLLR